VTAPLVDSFISGESAVLLVYGAAGSGKTHTLQVSSSSTHLTTNVTQPSKH
jgi:Cdc6-like AAA superfamily ATPase